VAVVTDAHGFVGGHTVDSYNRCAGGTDGVRSGVHGVRPSRQEPLSKIYAEETASGSMNDGEGTNLDPVLQAHRLTERFLDGPRTEERTNRKVEIERKLAELNERIEKLPSDDPLHRLYEDAIDWQQEEYETAIADSTEAERRFLELVAEQFIAEGRWLNPEIQRALNELLFDDPGEFVAVDGVRLAPPIEIDPVARAELSTEIRALATEELHARDG
jgi:hypothetical protein